MNAAERERIFEALFKSHFRDLTRFVFGYVNDEEAAKDIVHDAFLAIWQKLEFLDASYPMHPYLYTLCRNGALDYLKHLRVVNENERELSAHLQSEAEEEKIQLEKRIEQVKEKLLLLPDKQREALQKYFLEGKKYKEVAEELGIAVNSVKTHIFRGLNALRQHLREDLILYFLLQA
jgi:RNA polymerase sigma-70 factor (ECF subfamily)